jgi:hypothetical protein
MFRWWNLWQNESKWRFLTKGYNLMERSELIAGAITDNEMWNFTQYSAH